MPNFLLLYTYSSSPMHYFIRPFQIDFQSLLLRSPPKLCCWPSRLHPQVIPPYSSQQILCIRITGCIQQLLCVQKVLNCRELCSRLMSTWNLMVSVGLIIPLHPNSEFLEVPHCTLQILKSW